MKPKHISDASQLEEPERFCTCCEKRLKRKFAWLELDQRDNTYHDRGDVPSDQSQGWFPFGMTCAKRKLAEAKGEAA